MEQCWCIRQFFVSLSTFFSIHEDIFSNELRELKRIIERDIKALQRHGVGCKNENWTLTGQFRKVTQTFYAYCHPNHAIFSSLTSEIMFNLFRVPTRGYVTADLKFCEEQHVDHDALQACLSPNDSYLFRLNKRLEQIEDPGKKAELQTLIQSVDKLFSPPVLALDWNDNEWSQRIASCINSLGDYQAVFTGTSAAAGFSAFAGSQCNGIVDTGFFMFHGSPDILISKSKCISIATSQFPSSSSDEDDQHAIENCHQRNPIKTDGTGLPTKFGELFAALHFLLVCKVIRKLRKGKVPDTLMIKGLLLDRLCGIHRCELTGRIVQPNEQESQLDIKVFQSVDIIDAAREDSKVKPEGVKIWFSMTGQIIIIQWCHSYLPFNPFFERFCIFIEFCNILEVATGHFLSCWEQCLKRGTLPRLS